MSPAWVDVLAADPRPWLLEPTDPAVRAAALRSLLGRPADDAEVAEARSRALAVDPIAGILAAQHEEGWWEKPGPGYAPKYRGTVWNLIFLDQLGAEPAHPGIQRACAHVLARCPTSAGGFGASGSHLERNPPPSAAIHCLNGNLARALIRFGHLDHPAVRAATDWAARTILGEGVDRWYASGTSGPGFACAGNDRQPCAWGAVKEVLALAAIPPEARTGREERAAAAGAAFLLSHDPAVADYPMGFGNTKPNGSWFKPGFPTGYVTDVLQTLQALGELGHATDARLDHAYDWLVGLADGQGRWTNRNASTGKTTVPIEKQGAPSKWVTLRACTVLRARYGDQQETDR